MNASQSHKVACEANDLRYMKKHGKGSLFFFFLTTWKSFKVRENNINLIKLKVCLSLKKLKE